MFLNKKIIIGLLSLSAMTSIGTSIPSAPANAKSVYTAPVAYRGTWVGKWGTHVTVVANGAYVGSAFGSFKKEAKSQWHGIYPKNGGQPAAIKFSHGKLCLLMAAQKIWCHKV